MSHPPSDDAPSTAWFDVFEIQEGAHRGCIHDRALAVRACRAVLKLVKSHAVRAVVDAYTDYRKLMPPDAEAAEQVLWTIGKQQHRRDPGMNVELDLSCAEGWDLLDRCAPWSINVDVYDVEGDEIVNFHDCGLLVTARLTVDQAAKLATDLSDALHVEKRDEPH